ncbi:MAG: hypothetical protein H2069_07785 [Legionella sp.]|nr:hypothetical protein [Legionella sp.]
MSDEQEMLFYSIINNNHSMIKMLLDEKIVDPNKPFIFEKKSKVPPLALALMHERKEIALELLTYGAKANYKMKSRSGQVSTVFTQFMFITDREILFEMLKQPGIGLNDILKQPYHQNTSFYYPVRLWHLFCLSGDTEVVQYLVENKHDLLMSTGGAFSILQLLQPKKYSEVNELYKNSLRKIDTDPNTIEKRIAFLVLGVLQSAIKAEENGDLKALGNITNELDRISKNFTEKEMGIFLMLLMQFTFSQKSAVETFIKKKLMPIAGLYCSVRELYSGGNKHHEKVCDMLLSIKPTITNINAHKKTTQTTSKNSFLFKLFCCGKNIDVQEPLPTKSCVQER